jgi:Tol biopolymer transport system component
LTRGASLDRQPDYTSDGTAIVFSSTSSGNLDVWRLSKEGGTPKRLTDDPSDDFDPRLTRDGRYLLWSSRRSGNYEVWIANADGTDARKLTSDGVDAENPTATPDGEWIVYNSYDPAKRGIWKIKRDGSGATRIVEGETRLPEISPDGNHVAYSTIGVGARQKVVRLGDGMQFDLSPLTNIPRQNQFGSFTSGRSRWMPDGKSLAFVDCDMSGQCGVFAQEFVAGRDTLATRRRLTGFEEFAHVESFSFSPDGKRITVSAVENSQTIMITDPIPALQDRGAAR